jgi:hypothetical protein
MSTFSTRILPIAMLTLVLAIVGGAITWSVLASSKLPDGPADIVWDKSACVACGMHIGEPPFAAQATTKDGRVHAFDDPGCLFLWVEEAKPELHSLFFRHHRENRWLGKQAVGFIAVEPTPMGFGLAAVDSSTPGALDYDQARGKCLQRAGGHEGGK